MGQSFQGIPQIPYQGRQLQTQPFQPLEGYPGTQKRGYVYSSYQNPPYIEAHIPIAQEIPSYPGYPPLDFNRKLPFVAVSVNFNRNRTKKLTLAVHNKQP